MNEEITLELGTMYRPEIESLEKEFKRIKEKYELMESPCSYQVIEIYPVEDGFRMAVMANRDMLAAFVKEQMT